MPATLARTALYEPHVKLQARMVPFAGWEMPVQYEGIIAEHRTVRSAWGIFDVSHMGRIYFSGDGAPALLDHLVTADIARLATGRARYGFICLDNGGILDDVVTLRIRDDLYLLVCNAANRRAVLEWVQERMRPFPSVDLSDITEDTVMIAAQGPQAKDRMDSLLQGRPSLLKRYAGTETEWEDEDVLITRTGYTGEDGFELIVQNDIGAALWEQLLDEGAKPCGLGARDTLRLEAGLPLHGQDIDATVNPIEAGLERFVHLEGGDFIGKTAIRETLRAGPAKRLVGFKARERNPVPRHGFPLLLDGRRVGEVTSGNFSPTLEINIGMGYVPASAAQPGTRLQCLARGRLADVDVVSLPFYKRRD